MNNELNNPKTLWAWSMYDWANSVYSLTITTAIFPIYYESVTRNYAQKNNLLDGENPLIRLFGFEIGNTAAYSYALSLAFLIVAICTPMLSGIADYGGFKRKFMQFFVWLGSLSCLSLYFFDTDNVQIGLIGFVLATVGYAGSIVFYNAFLPLIATEDQYDQVSARGYALGYLGSVILLIINLVVIQFPDWFFSVQAYADSLFESGKALTKTDAFEAAITHYQIFATKLAFVSVGVWWLLFAQITFRYLPREEPQGFVSKANIFSGLKQLKIVYTELSTNKNLKKYLFGFFFVNMGLQTVMYVASLFGAKELKLASSELILTVLVIQLVAIGGSWVFAKTSSKLGNMHTLLIGTAIWSVICVLAFYVQTNYQFFALAGLVGLVMGGMQALMRSTFSKLMPDHTPNTASYFSFYDITEKMAIVFGTFAYGFLEQLSGNMRVSTLVLGLFFIFGFLFFRTIPNFKIHRG